MKRCKKGRGIVSTILNKASDILPISTVVNKAIDLLPIEAHLPGYRYCGPGTKLAKRLARKESGINPLDEACKAHDIAYSKHSDTKNRAKADKELQEKAWKRFKSSDSSIGEKAAAWAVTTAMKAKSSLGSGKRKSRSSKQAKKRKSDNKGQGLFLKPYVNKGKGLSSRQGKSKIKKKKN